MSDSYDNPTVDTSAISPVSDEGGRFQLSREMKILLGVLALGAAVGGWYVFSGAGAPAPEIDTAATPPAQSSGAAAQAATSPTAGIPASGAPVSGTPVVPGVTPSTGANAAGGQATTPGVTTGTSAVAVPEVPFLNPQGSASGDGATPDPTAQAGINPVDPLAAVPVNNPFKPLTVVNTNAPTSTAAVSAPPTSLPSTPTPLPQGNPQGTAPQGTVPGLSTAGAVPLPNVPLAGVGNSGGAALGSQTASAGSTPGNGLGTGGAIPLPNVPLGGTAAAPGGQNARPATQLPTTAVTPPAGSITPGLSAPALGGLALGLPGTPDRSPAEPPSTGASATALAAGNVSQPGVISQYGSTNAPASAVVSPLDQVVQSRTLVFNAVVLGPINTAIFKTDKGFVVVPTGQTLPDSNVTLKEVTATSATLSLGADSKILELDKR